jgi:sporulation protein YlmC with PRC-barrel domain
MTRQRKSSRSSAVGTPSLWEAHYTPVPSLPQVGSGHQRETASILITLLVMFGLMLVVVSSKPALSQGVQLVKVDVSVVGKGFRASKLIGANVVNDKNESVGKIDDIIIDNNNVMFAVLQVGGFLGLGSRLVAVPYDSLKVADDGKKVELPGATKDELKKLAEFKYLG